MQWGWRNFFENIFGLLPGPKDPAENGPKSRGNRHQRRGQSRLPRHNARVEIVAPGQVVRAVSEVRRAATGVLSLHVARARAANPFAAAGRQPHWMRIAKPLAISRPVTACASFFACRNGSDYANIGLFRWQQASRICLAAPKPPHFLDSAPAWCANIATKAG